MATEMVKVKVHTDCGIHEHTFKSNEGDVFIDGEAISIFAPEFGHLVIRYDGTCSDGKFNRTAIYPIDNWESLSITRYPIS